MKTAKAQPIPTFSPDTLAFLKKASRQKTNASWLDSPKNQAEYERVLKNPLQHLARTLKAELQGAARDYNFPQKGLARIKRSADRAKEYGSCYKDWVSYSAARPRTSRFDHNPNIFFLIQADDKDDPFLIAGGLYMPSSRQLRTIRDGIAFDASAFDALFASKEFAKTFPGGFSHERKATRPPRGYDPAHERIEWLKLQGFFVWRGYKKSEWTSKNFAQLVVRDARQILRLNALLEPMLGIGSSLAKAADATKPSARKKPSSDLLERLEGITAPRREMDF